MPSPANGDGACVFQPAGLLTTSRCSSSKRTQGIMARRKSSNTEHPTSNIQSTLRWCGGGGWALEVGCSVFDVSQSHQNPHAPCHTIQRPSRKFVMACAV